MRHGDGQRFVDLRQLTRNGSGRCSGLGRTMHGIGILKPSTAAGAYVKLGLTGRGYDVREDDQHYREFWRIFSDESWTTHVDAVSFPTFCVKVRKLLHRLAKQMHVLGLAAGGYCFHFLYRKLLIGEAHFRARSTSLAAVDWHSLTVRELKYMSADQNDHLSDFDENTPAAGLSDFFFRPTDWPLFLSCFACLWKETLQADGDVEQLAGSEALRTFALEWIERNGIPPHPTVLLAEFREWNNANKPPPRKQRKLVHCISDEV